MPGASERLSGMVPDTPDRVDASRLRHQLARLHAVLHPDDVTSCREAVELLGVGDDTTLYVAVRVTALPLPRPGTRGDWRLTIVSLTGLDAEGMRFVPVPPPVAADLLAGLGLPTRPLARAGSLEGERCTVIHALVRDHAKGGRPEGEAGRRPGQTPVPGPPP
jgi:hypothetical protein